MKLIFWIYLRVLAVVIYVQFIGSQFYDPTSEGLAESIYRIIDPLMVLGLLIAVYYANQRKRAVDTGLDDGVTREYLEANGTFYLSIALLVGLLWNWVGFQFANPVNTYGWLWTVSDVTLPLLFFATSIQLMKNVE